MQFLKIRIKSKNKVILTMGLINQSPNLSCLKCQEIATPSYLGITFEHIAKIGSRLDHLRKFITSEIQIDLNIDMHSRSRN